MRKLGIAILGAVASLLGIAPPLGAAPSATAVDYISSPQSNQVYHLNGAPTVGVTANSEHDHALDGFTPNTNTTVYTFGSLTMPGAVVQYARTENVTFDAMGHWEKTNPLSNARKLRGVSTHGH